MSKTVDANGYWLVRENPVTKPGIFPYLGKQISSELEPNKVYHVYRPLEEISRKETLDSFNGVPLINEHEMLGKDYTSYDERPASGVMMNPRASNNMIVADIKIFSESMKDAIANGKKELSLGYRCDYEYRPGEYNGQAYDYVQTNLRGNHVALVSRGRMGSDVRVYDSFATDSMEVLPSEWIAFHASDEDNTETDNNNKEKGEDMDEPEKKDEEKKQTENPATEPESATADVEEEKKTEDEDAKSAEPEKKETEDEDGKEEPGKKSEDEDEKKDEGEKKEDEKKPGMDEAFWLKRFEERNKLASSMSKFVGDFATDGMSVEDVAIYCADKLGLEYQTGREALVAVKAFALGKRADATIVANDEAINRTSTREDFLKKYLGK